MDAKKLINSQSTLLVPPLKTSVPIGRISLMASDGPLVVLIAGGSASGKTFLSKYITACIGADRVTCLSQDAYYKAQRQMPAELLAQGNFDHPEAVDQELLATHVRALSAGSLVEMPIYDFTVSDRLQETQTIFPTPLILVDGLFVLGYEPLRTLSQLRLYVAWPESLRLVRRLRRDTVERGRAVSSVVRQYFATVRPMHQRFVEPSRRYAHKVVLGNDRGYRLATDFVLAHITDADLLEPARRLGSRPPFNPWDRSHALVRGV